MALEVVGAFATGVAAGWVGRSLARSTRGLFVGLVAATLRAKEGLSRMLGRTTEWVEDVIAEGKAHYESGRTPHEPLAEVPGTEVQPHE